MKNYSVSEFTKTVKNLIEGTFSETVAVTGEVSNFMKASSGHVYFVLKDGGAQLRAAFFKRYSMGSGTFIPKNGDKVQAIGDVTLYEADGSYQLLVKKILYDSAGDFWRKFEETKRKLEAEGLFDQERKRSVAIYPRRIALVTSLSGAAVKDFIVTAQNAGAGFDIEIWGVPVQGAEAASKIASAVMVAGKLINRYDAIVIMRGGGSLEDLSVFNDEAVVRAVAGSKVPTVSAIGHERDVTVTDFAADVRGATPTAAATILSAGYLGGARFAESLEERIITATVNKIGKLYRDIDYIDLRLDRSSPFAIIRGYENRLRLASGRLNFSVTGRVSGLKNRVEKLSSRVEKYDPARAFVVLNAKVIALERFLRNLMISRLSLYKRRLSEANGKLGILNPENVLGRGYALVIKDGSVITSAGDVALKENIEIKMKDGYISSFVVGKTLEDTNGQNTNNT